ncbi:hypothetical protein [Mucilaginibacter segetis]|uniref:Uncharacterized protein n=1 Tax=Mucilaginibacter segetis TaxID=2793071 RepID=A0A934UM85_9SPHI|nr:hypothetical protein [Mucilaginibacter segetis]MBK0378622.1 hypothetical protein [Mucilaginibacter segetis]
MRLCLLLLSFFIWPFFSRAQDTLLVKMQANRLAEATFKGDYNTVIDLTYPKLIELSGGRGALQKLITEKMAGLKKQGIVEFNGSVGSPGKFFRAGDQLHCLIPEMIILKSVTGHYVAHSYLLGISSDNGKSWTFLDVGNMPDNVLHRLLPNFNKELIIPESSKPEFIPD